MTRGEKVIAFIQGFCVSPEGKHVGQPMVLADFQKKFLLDVYDNPAGTRRAYLSVSRKNGKTGLIAGILLAHLVGPEAKQNSQLVSGAMSREQAALVFGLASKMVMMNPALSGIVKIVPSSKRLIGLPMNTEYKALAAEGKTAHGLSPILAILDEVGQVRGPKSAFVEAITTSQGAHANPLLIAISTQASDDADLFSVWLDDAKESNDPRIVSHVYEAPEEADLMDESGWKASNPALGIFRDYDDLAEQAKQAVRMPSAESGFRNLCLNQRISTFSPFVSKNVWLENAGDPGEMEGFELYGGLDLSARTDLTALVLVGICDNITKVWPFFWTPEGGLRDRSDRDRQPYDVWVKQGFLRTTPGNTVGYDFVARDIASIIGSNDIKGIAFDRWRIDVMRKDCERDGISLPLVEFGQGFKDMAPAIDVLEEALLNCSLQHGGHRVLTMCAANAVVIKDPAGNRKLDKQKATGRIDGMVALAMALGAAQKTIEDVGDFSSFLARPLGR